MMQWCDFTEYSKYQNLLCSHNLYQWFDIDSFFGHLKTAFQLYFRCPIFKANSTFLIKINNMFLIFCYLYYNHLKVQSCILCSTKYRIASTQITTTEIFTFIAVLVFKLLSCKVLFINRKDNRNCWKAGYFLRRE